MNSHVIYGSLLLLAAGVAHGQPGIAAAPQCAQNTLDANCQKGLRTEIQNLRIELLELRIEAQSGKVLSLEHSRSEIAAERLKLAEEERASPIQVTNFSSQFAGQDLTPEQRADLDRVSGAFATAQIERSQRERSSLQAREAETAAALHREQQRLDVLKTKLKEMNTAQ